jgi:hypothetical protein
MNFLSINDHTILFIMKLFVEIQVPISRFKDTSIIICIWIKGTHEKKRCFVTKMSHPFFNIVKIITSYNNSPKQKTPQQNWVAKKMNHSFLDKATSMVFKNGTPNHFWVEAINNTTFLLNRCLTKVNYQIILKQIFSRMKLDINHLWMFKCQVYIHGLKEDKT